MPLGRFVLGVFVFAGAWAAIYSIMTEGQRRAMLADMRDALLAAARAGVPVQVAFLGLESVVTTTGEA